MIARLNFAVFILLVALQVADGMLTVRGISSAGIGYEANPLIVFMVKHLGAIQALAVAKIVSIACGALLFLKSEQKIPRWSLWILTAMSAIVYLLHLSELGIIAKVMNR